eukprot:10049434-Alexandrium_andersonii.AAC.1
MLPHTAAGSRSGRVELPTDRPAVLKPARQTAQAERPLPRAARRVPGNTHGLITRGQRAAQAAAASANGQPAACLLYTSDAADDM